MDQHSKYPWIVDHRPNGATLQRLSAGASTVGEESERLAPFGIPTVWTNLESGLEVLVRGLWQPGNGGNYLAINVVAISPAKPSRDITQNVADIPVRIKFDDFDGDFESDSEVFAKDALAAVAAYLGQ